MLTTESSLSLSLVHWNPKNINFLFRFLYYPLLLDRFHLLLRLRLVLTLPNSRTQLSVQGPTNG